MVSAGSREKSDQASKLSAPVNCQSGARVVSPVAGLDPDLPEAHSAAQRENWAIRAQQILGNRAMGKMIERVPSAATQSRRNLGAGVPSLGSAHVEHPVHQPVRSMALTGASDARMNHEVPGAVLDELRNGSGKPLGQGDRDFLEARMGTRLEGVRVHESSSAARAARLIDARAFTAGNEVVIGDVGGTTRQDVLVHELAHVAQLEPSARRVLPARLKLGAINDPAEAAAARSARDLNRPAVTSSQTNVIRRLPAASVNAAQVADSRSNPRKDPDDIVSAYDPRIVQDKARIRECILSDVASNKSGQEILSILTKYYFLDQNKMILNPQRGYASLNTILTALAQLGAVDIGWVFCDFKAPIDILWFKLSEPWKAQYQYYYKLTTLGKGRQPEVSPNYWKQLGKQEAVGVLGILKGIGQGVAGIVDDAGFLAPGRHGSVKIQSNAASAWFSGAMDEAGDWWLGKDWSDGEAVLLGLSAKEMGELGGALVFTLATFEAKALEVLQAALALPNMLRTVSESSERIVVLTNRHRKGETLDYSEIAKDVEIWQAVVGIVGAIVGYLLAKLSHTNNGEKIGVKLAKYLLEGAPIGPIVAKIAIAISSEAPPEAKSHALGAALAELLKTVAAIGGSRLKNIQLGSGKEGPRTPTAKAEQAQQVPSQMILSAPEFTPPGQLATKPKTAAAVTKEAPAASPKATSAATGVGNEAPSRFEARLRDVERAKSAQTVTVAPESPSPSVAARFGKIQPSKSAPAVTVAPESPSPSVAARFGKIQVSEPLKSLTSASADPGSASVANVVSKVEPVAQKGPVAVSEAAANPLESVAKPLTQAEPTTQQVPGDMPVQRAQPAAEVPKSPAVIATDPSQADALSPTPSTQLSPTPAKPALNQEVSKPAAVVGEHPQQTAAKRELVKLNDTRVAKSRELDNVRNQRAALKELEQRAATARDAAQQERMRAVKTGDHAALEKAREQQRAAHEEFRQANLAREELASVQSSLSQELDKLNQDITRQRAIAEPMSRIPLPCFESATLVLTPLGPRPIADLLCGDEVFTHDFSTGTTQARPIVQIQHGQTEAFYCIQTSRGAVRATSQHRFWIDNLSGWHAAENLKPGMQLRMYDDCPLELLTITRQLAPKAPTFNLSIDEFHTYFVGPGILVHNEAVDLGLGGGFVIYRATNDKFPGKVYIGQTTELDIHGKPRGAETRQEEHQSKAQSKLALHEQQIEPLSADDEAFYRFMQEAKLEPIVTGIATQDQADFLEQKNIDREKFINGESAVVNRRNEITSETHMNEVVGRILADPAVKERFCP